MKRKRLTVWKEDRGQGSVFYFVDEEGKKISANLYLSYHAGGREQMFSSKTSDLADAKRELRERLRNRENASEGKEVLVTPKLERVTVSDLLDANLRRATEKGRASLSQMGYRTKTLRRLLGSIRAVEFGPEDVDRYKAQRRKAVTDNKGRRRKALGDTSIRKELEILNRAFTYAVERGVLRAAPFIEKPTVDNVRSQEIPLEKFRGILDAIEDTDTRDFCEWLLLTAARPKGVRALRWELFDGQRWTLTVPAEKGGDARAYAVEGSLRRVIERRLAVRDFECPYIFHSGGAKLDERRVRRNFYRALEACGFTAGRKGFTLYDTKKTAAGLLIDAGLSEREAMAFSGHKTPSMFDRYVIKSSERHRASVRKRDEYMERRLAENRGSDAERVLVFPKVSEVS